MTEPAPEDLAAAKPAKASDQTAELRPAPGLASMLGSSITVLGRPPWVFDEAARAQVPSWWVMAANVLVFASGGQAAALVLRLIGSPGPVSPERLVMLHAGAAAATLAASFLIAAVADVIARVADSDAGFPRSYQVVSLCSGVTVLSLILQQMPALWFVPTVWGFLLLGWGIQRVHGAHAGRTWVFLGVLAAAALAGQWYGNRRLRMVSESAAAASAVMSEMQRLRAELEKSLPALQTGGAPPPAAGSEPPAGRLGRSAAGPTGGQDTGSALRPNAFANPEAMVLPPEDMPPLGPAEGAVPAQVDAALQSSMGLFRAILPMLKNPQLTKSLPPEQAAQIQQLTKMVSQLERNMAQGRGPTDQDLAKIMQMLMRAQATAITPQGPAGPPSNQQGRQPRGQPGKPSSPAPPGATPLEAQEPR
ncbi:MAG: YIP1 family protein [Elusimicrobia bacterium]|nr:YIP1 family protein [Elusimicrobiota bacterium]